MSLCDLQWVAIEVATSQNRQNEGPASSSRALARATREVGLVFAVTDAVTLAGALGIDRYSFVHTVFSSR